MLDSVDSEIRKLEHKLITSNGQMLTIKQCNIVNFIYLVQKETQCFYLQFLGLKIIDFKNCFNSVVLPSNKDLDCIVSW